ncbi:MAG: R3H domain-containing nucleic acid-binding protein [bacterium]|nr:R3H domain-containing nucleic acid-binding protein [bacterium]
MNDSHLMISSAAEDLLKRIQVDGIVKTRHEQDTVMVEIESAEAARLIGNKGEVLDAFEHLLRSLLNKQMEGFVSVRVDVEGYRKRRAEYLSGLVKNICSRVASSGKHEALNPMSASERRLVHMIVQEMEGVISESIGEKADRQVVIKPIMKKVG